MKMLIGGKKSDSSDMKTITVVNPATGAVLDTIPAATKNDVGQCVKIALEGKKRWQKTPMHERIRLMRLYTEALREHKKEITELLCAESGKPIAQCEGELAASIAGTNSYINRAEHVYSEVMPETEPGQEGHIVYTKREPLGILAAIIPFNYPIGLYVHKMAPALLMGNVVIAKPASVTPLTCLRIVEIGVEAGIPDYALQSVTGAGNEVGTWLVSDSRIDAVSFTGSTDVGIDILSNAAKNVLHVCVELGGNDPLIICADADLDLAVEESLGGRIGHAGQVCSASKRFFVQKSVKDAFTEKLIARLAGLKIGDPMDRSVDMACLASEKNAIKLEQQLAMTVSQGANCIFGGKKLQHAFFEPTVLTDVTMAMDIAKDLEVFGPVFPIIEFDDINEAIENANASKYGLQGGVITENVSLGLYVASNLECGCAVVNGTGNYRHIDQPFGGYKMSGLGREGVLDGLEEMSQIKTIVLKNILKEF